MYGIKSFIWVDKKLSMNMNSILLKDDKIPEKLEQNILYKLLTNKNR